MLNYMCYTRPSIQPNAVCFSIYMCVFVIFHHRQLMFSVILGNFLNLYFIMIEITVDPEERTHARTHTQQLIVKDRNCFLSYRSYYLISIHEEMWKDISSHSQIICS